MQEKISKILADFNNIVEKKRLVDKRKRMTIPERSIVKDEKDYRVFQKNIKNTIKRINNASKEIKYMKRKHHIDRKNLSMQEIKSSHYGSSKYQVVTERPYNFVDNNKSRYDSS